MLDVCSGGGRKGEGGGTVDRKGVAERVCVEVLKSREQMGRKMEDVGEEFKRRQERWRRFYNR